MQSSKNVNLPNCKETPSISLFSSPQTPVKVGKGKSQKENNSRCLCSGINFHGAGSSYNLNTNETLVEKITAPIQGKLDPERWFCKACFWRVESLNKKSSTLAVRFCKSLDVNLTEITTKYPLMNTKSMNLMLAVPGRWYQASVQRLSLVKWSPSTSIEKIESFLCSYVSFKMAPKRRKIVPLLAMLQNVVQFQAKITLMSVLWRQFCELGRSSAV